MSPQKQDQPSSSPSSYSRGGKKNGKYTGQIKTGGDPKMITIEEPSNTARLSEAIFPAGDHDQKTVLETAPSSPAVRQLGVISGLAAASIWGGMYVVSKVVLEVIPPFALIALRLFLGILALGLVVAWKGGTGLNRRQVGQVVAVGFVGYGVSLSFQFIGTKLSTASNGALVTSATPAFVLLFAAWVLREKITLRRLVALGVSTLGVLAVIDPRTAQISPSLFWGNISLVAAAVTWALYSVLVRKVTRKLDTLSVSLVAFFGGLLITVPAGAWEVRSIGLGEITPGIIAGVLFLGIISTALAMFLWNNAFATLEAGVASLTFFAQPVVGAGLGALFLGERLTPLFLAGGVLIGLGLWLAAGEN